MQSVCMFEKLAILFVLATCLLASSVDAAVRADGSVNILLVIADDMGVDKTSAYAEQASAPFTPTLEVLAERGVLFRNAWAHAMCSPTRASVMTGRHAFRHGVGSPGGVQMNESEETIAEVLGAAGYATALFGKWHLGTQEGSLPTDQGFDFWSGTIANMEDYFSWVRTEIDASGEVREFEESRYATTAEAEDALAWIGEQGSSPWFVTLAFHTPHSPFHVPPEHLYSGITLNGQAGDRCNRTGPDEVSDCYAAMVQAMDTELGLLLQGLEELGVSDDTLIVFLGDNGTPGGATVTEEGSPFSREHAKGTVYEGGVNVPLIITAGVNVGITMTGSEQADLVMAMDLFATFAEIGAATPSSGNTVDAVSLLPYLETGQSPDRRAWVYSELYGEEDDRWAITDGQWKFLSNEGNMECYLLSRDAAESRDLLRRLNVGGSFKGKAPSGPCLELAAQRPCKAGVNCLPDL